MKTLKVYFVAGVEIFEENDDVKITVTPDSVVEIHTMEHPTDDSESKVTLRSIFNTPFEIISQ